MDKDEKRNGDAPSLGERIDRIRGKLDVIRQNAPAYGKSAYDIGLAMKAVERELKAIKSGADVPEHPAVADLANLYILGDGLRVAAMMLLDSVRQIQELGYVVLKEAIAAGNIPVE